MYDVLSIILEKKMDFMPVSYKGKEKKTSLHLTSIVCTL